MQKVEKYSKKNTEKFTEKFTPAVSINTPSRTVFCSTEQAIPTNEQCKCNPGSSIRSTFIYNKPAYWCEKIL
jgi:hypothetical protein